MSHQALARKYRPQSFRDVIGQETVVRTLQNAIEQNRIHHAYLFSGVRGVGKTTSARILAKCLNCATGPTIEPCNECSHCREITEGIDLDVREIDAATYTGVDNVRELRDVSQFQPARDRYRIFIIDEAHMLSSGAWNALLKLIEEPPPHVIFMFATTEMHKVPQTILSRVQKFLLRKIVLEEMIGRLREICDAEGIEADREALEIVARRGEGSVRDSLSLLDQVIAFSGRSISGTDVATVLGLSDTNFFSRIVGQIADGNHAGILETLQEASDSGRDFKMLYRDLLNFIRNLLLVAGRANSSMLSVSPEDLAVIESSAEQFSYTDLLRIANLLLRDDETVNRAEHQRLAVEIALLKAATFPRLRAVEEVLTGSAPAPSRGATASNRTVAAPRAKASEAAPREESTPRVDAAPARMAAPIRNDPPAAPAPSTSRAEAARRDPEPEEEAPRRAPRASSSGGGDVAAFVDRVQSTRRGLYAYLSAAKSHRREGNRITFLFDASDNSFADFLKDDAASLEALAGEVLGEPVKLEFKVENEAPAAGRRAEERPSPLREDPVMKAFAKHLGGEIVEPRKR